jgi:excisionase family DNA binding protein
MEKRLMTVEEVADYLRIKPGTVYDWAKMGKIPAIKVGRLWRFDSGTIEAWVKSGMNRESISVAER